jgi:putative lipoprotein
MLPAGRQTPFAFKLRYDPRRIKERGSYVIRVRITDGARLLFTNTETYPVITGGHPDTVNVIAEPGRR